MIVRLFALGAVACAPELEALSEGGVSDPASASESLVGEEEGWRWRNQPATGIGALGVGEEALASSVRDFSPVQGEKGWFYGYYDVAESDEFQPMAQFSSGGADPGWYVTTGGLYWTMMDASTMHPNGEVTTGGRSPVEHWAVRRWVSDYEGDVRITGHFGKYWADGESNGVGGYIFVDDEMSWAWYIEGWDTSGVEFDRVFTVQVGSTIDFAVEPWESDDRSDRSTFTAEIWEF